MKITKENGKCSEAESREPTADIQIPKNEMFRLLFTFAKKEKKNETEME